MVVHCVVVGCTNYFGKKPGLRFFRFPSERCSEKRAKWIAAVRRERWIPGKSARICGAHFVSGQYCHKRITSFGI